MLFDKILHATQYYRTPTPLENEWELDISNFENLSLDAFQIRINWRWNERVEGVYDFSDVDKLMELAVKHNRKVIIKFLLECAPQYVFDKYEGTIIGPKGEQIRGGSHGAFFGGWRPCFTNPKVRERATLFVEEVVKRYKDHPNLILYNAWNEIRNRPIEECFCPHCRAAYGKYLKSKFGTIEALNSFYGTAEESFENVALPSTPHGYWDIYEFKKFKGSHELKEWLSFVYNAVRKYDKKHPVMSHVGFAGAFQNDINDVCDDYEVSKAVDFFGTSIPCKCAMDTPENRLDFMMLNDYVRSIDKDYFLYEIYPGLGMFKDEYDTPADMTFKLYNALSNGAKGLVYWQYRAERVGMENDCAGIMRADGSPRPVAGAVADFGRDLNKNMEYFLDAYPERADVAIVFDFDSMLLSEIEDSCGENFKFHNHNQVYYYLRSHAGMYKFLKTHNYNVDYVSSKTPEKWSDYKVLYFPYHNMLDCKTAQSISNYVKNGGVVIADEGFGLREMNTWMQAYDITCPMMSARMRERRFANATVVIDGEKTVVAPFKTEYAVSDSSVSVCFDDGTPAICSVTSGEGTLYLSGFGIGYTMYTTPSDPLCRLLENMLLNAGVKKDASDFSRGIYTRALESDKYKTVFVFNMSDADFNKTLDILPIATGGAAVLNGNTLSVASGEIGYFTFNK